VLERGALSRKHLLASIAALLAGGCNALLPSRVVVKNDSDCTVRDIVVDIAGARHGRKKIRPGESASFTAYADRDGVVALRYVVRGHEVRRSFEYVSGYVSVRCKVSIGAAGDPTVRC
jgi:hypothetical protein